MKKVILFSDAHGMTSIFDFLEETYPDTIKLCMGDCVMPWELYLKYKNDILFVRGNSDGYLSIPMEEEIDYPGVKVLYRESEELIPDEMVVEIEGVTIIMSHGHLLPYDLYNYVQAWQADLLVFGHTHRYKVLKDDDNKIYGINPGSCNPYRVRDIDENWMRKPASICELTLDNGKILDVNKIELACV